MILWTVITMSVLLATVSPLAWAKPADCTDQTFATAQTLTFDPTETDITVKFTRCKYNAGVTITSSTASPLLRVSIDMTNCTATTLAVSTNVNVSYGSTLTFANPTLTSTFTLSASAHATGVVTVSRLTTTAQVSLQSGIYTNGATLTFTGASVQVATTYALYWGSMRLQKSNLNLGGLFKTTLASASYGIYQTGITMQEASISFIGVTATGAHGLYVADYTLTQGTIYSIASSSFTSNANANFNVYMLVTGGNFVYDKSNSVSGGTFSVIHNARTSAMDVTVVGSAYQLTYNGANTNPASSGIHLGTAGLATTLLTVSLGNMTDSALSFISATVADNIALSWVTCANSSIFIGNGVVTNYITYTGTTLSGTNITTNNTKITNYYWSFSSTNVVDSTVMFSFVTAVYASTAGTFTRSNLLIYSTTLTGAGYNALTVGNSFVNSLMHVDACNFATTTLHVIRINTNLPSGGVHRYTNSILNNKYTGTSSATQPAQSVISYASGVNILPGSLVHMAANALTAVVAVTYLLYLVSTGGQFIHEDSNRCASIGTFYVSTTAASTGPHTIHISKYTALTTLSIAHTAAAAMTGESVRITDSVITNCDVNTGTSDGLEFNVSTSTCSGYLSLTMGSRSSGASVSIRKLTSPNLGVSIGAAVSGSFIGVYDSTVTTINFDGTITRNSSVLASGNTLTTVMTMAISSNCTADLPCVIDIRSNKITSTTYALLLSGSIIDATVLNIISNTMSSTGNYNPLYFSTANSVRGGGGMSISANTITAKTGYMGMAFAAVLTFTGPLDVWRNTFVTGGMSINLGVNPSSVNFVGNTAPSFALAGSSPSVAGSRIMSCNQASSVDWSSTLIGFTSVACAASNTVNRCAASFTQPVTDTDLTVCITSTTVSTSPTIVSFARLLTDSVTYELLTGPFVRSPFYVQPTNNDDKLAIANALVAATIQAFNVAPLPFYVPPNYAVVIPAIVGAPTSINLVKSCAIPDAVLEVIPVVATSFTLSVTRTHVATQSIDPHTRTQSMHRTVTPSLIPPPTTTSTTITSTTVTSVTSTAAPVATTAEVTTAEQVATTAEVTTAEASTTEVTTVEASTAAPVATTAEATTAALVATTAVPVATTAAPVATTAEPTTAEPTTDAPVATTAEPTTAVPVATTAAPVTTTAEATTAAPVATTDAPVATTAEATTAALVATTAVPVAAPVATTAEPTTAAPVATTAEATTAAPVATTTSVLPTTTMRSLINASTSTRIDWAEAQRAGSLTVMAPLQNTGLADQTSVQVSPAWFVQTTVSGVTQTVQVASPDSFCTLRASGLSCMIAYSDQWGVTSGSNPIIKAIVATSVDGVEVNIVAEIAVDVSMIGNAVAQSSLDAASRTTDDTGMIFIGDPFSLEIHLATAVLLGPCASNGDNTLARYARYILSPFSDMGAAKVGLIHGLIATCAFLLHLIIVAIRAKSIGDTFAASAASLLFPSMSFIIAVLLYPGTIVAIVDMLRDGMKPVNMLVAVVHAVWVPAILIMVAVHWSKTGEFMKASPPASAMSKVFGPAGVWNLESQRIVLGVRGFVADSKSGKLYMIATVALIIMICFALFVTSSACGPRLFIGSVLCFVASAAVGALRPLVSLFSNITTAVSWAAVGVVILAHAIASVTDFSGAQGRGGLWYLKMIALLVLFVSTLLRTIHFAILILTQNNVQLAKDPEAFGSAAGAYEVDADDLDEKDSFAGLDDAKKALSPSKGVADDIVIVGDIDDDIAQYSSSEEGCQKSHRVNNSTSKVAAEVPVATLPTPWDDVSEDEGIVGAAAPRAASASATTIDEESDYVVTDDFDEPMRPASPKINSEDLVLPAADNSDYSEVSDGHRQEALMDDDVDGIHEAETSQRCTTDDEDSIKYTSDSSAVANDVINMLALPTNPTPRGIHQSYHYSNDLDEEENHF